MPMQPGSPQAQMRPGEDALIRKIQEIERVQREMLPSVALSIKPAMDDIRAQVAAIAALVGAQIEVGDFDHSETAFDPGTGTGGWPTVSAVTLTVPDGFTQAVVTAVAYVAIRNTTASTSTQIHCRSLVDDEGGPVDDERSEPGVRSTGLSVFSTRVTGLTGEGTFTVAAQAYAGADFAADAVNVATISGTVLWLR